MSGSEKCCVALQLWVVVRRSRALVDGASGAATTATRASREVRAWDFQRSLSARGGCSACRNEMPVT